MVSCFGLFFWHEQKKKGNEVEITLLPQNNQFLSEIWDGHLVLDNRRQRQKNYEGSKNENIFFKKGNINTIHADNMENDKFTCVYLKLLKFEEDA